MNDGHTLSGLGLSALGLGLLVAGCLTFMGARWVIRDDVLIRKRALERWSFVAWLKPAVWDGSDTRGPWIERFVRRQRWLLTWVYPVLACVWVIFCSVLIVAGLRGS
jgi:hypothetical protein